MIDYLIFALFTAFIIKNHYICWKIIKKLDEESLIGDEK